MYKYRYHLGDGSAWISKAKYKTIKIALEEGWKGAYERAHIAYTVPLMVETIPVKADSDA